MNSNCWISTEIKLPEFNKSVLIYTKEGGIAEGCLTSNYAWIQFRWSVTMPFPKVKQWCEFPQFKN